MVSQLTPRLSDYQRRFLVWLLDQPTAWAGGVHIMRRAVN